MFHPLLEGVLLGLTIAILTGPAFFTLIQTSIHRGLNSGLLLAMGIFLSDAALLMLCYLGASQIIYEGQNSLVFGMIGGTILVIFGIVTFRRKVHIDNEYVQQIRKPGPVTYILKGFLLNFANPFLWIFWMGVVVGITSNFGVDTTSIYVFFFGILATTLTTDFLKCFISHKIKQYMNLKILATINHVVGISLVLFGIVLIFRVLVNFAGLA
ncbi:MAG TPA: LysE family transporter [Bacteroidales bacterium]|nr:LysE family transporter [Bacteroidales bacterium]HSA43095.1 LysE family transporter [Bacteroidales bacterium]